MLCPIVPLVSQAHLGRVRFAMGPWPHEKDVHVGVGLETWDHRPTLQWWFFTIGPGHESPTLKLTYMCTYRFAIIDAVAVIVHVV